MTTQIQKLAQASGVCALDGCDQPRRAISNGGVSNYCSIGHSLEAERQRAQQRRGTKPTGTGPRIGRPPVQEEKRQEPKRPHFRLRLDPGVEFRPPADVIPPQRDAQGRIADFQVDVWASADHGSPGRLPTREVGQANVSPLWAIYSGGASP